MSLPYSAGYRKVARAFDSPIVPGAIYELRGNISPLVQVALPDSWIEDWLGRARTLKTEDGRFQVKGAVLYSTGEFAIQGVAQFGSPIILIIAGVLAVLAVISLGVVIQSCFEVVPDNNTGKGDTLTKNLSDYAVGAFLGIAIAIGGIVYLTRK